MPFTKNVAADQCPAGRFSATTSSTGTQMTGVPTLDKILCGGLPNGSLTCVEDGHATGPASILSKCFLSHACLMKQKIVVDQLTSELSIPLCKTHDAFSAKSGADVLQKQEFKIAWRYSGNSEVSAESEQRYSCDFENTTSLSAYDETLKLVFACEQNPLKMIEDFLKRPAIDSTSERKPAKICFHISSLANFNDKIDYKSVFKLKSLLRNFDSCAVIIIPSYLPIHTKHALLNLCDFYLKFAEFQVTVESQNEPMFKEYAGSVNFLKVWSYNSFKTSFQIVDLVYKFRRKNLVIEKGCLLPDLSETASRSEKRPELSKTGDLF